MEGEPAPPTNPPSILFQQVAREGNFGREQKADNHLKHCWCQVLEVNGVRQQPEQETPTAYFLVKKGLLYYCYQRCSETLNLLIFPQSKIIYLAYTHTLRGYLRACNVLEKLQNCFHWPGMVVEVNNFIKWCPQCPRMST